MKQDYYDILGVSKGASASEIRPRTGPRRSPVYPRPPNSRRGRVWVAPTCEVLLVGLQQLFPEEATFTVGANQAPKRASARRQVSLRQHGDKRAAPAAGNWPFKPCWDSDRIWAHNGRFRLPVGLQLIPALVDLADNAERLDVEVK